MGNLVVSPKIHAIDEILNGLCIAASEQHLAHFPDILTQSGLLDLLIVGNVIEFAEALSRPHFAGKVANHIKEEENVARWRYRQLMNWFAANHVIIMGNFVISPWYIMQLSLVRFASSLCAYMTRWKAASEIKGCTVPKFRAAVEKHLRRDYPELLGKFKSLESDPPPSFAWQGPNFSVVCRSNLSTEMASSEVRDLDSDRVYLGDLDEDDSNSSEESKESEEGEPVESPVRSPVEKPVAKQKMEMSDEKQVEWRRDDSPLTSQPSSSSDDVEDDNPGQDQHQSDMDIDSDLKTSQPEDDQLNADESSKSSQTVAVRSKGDSSKEAGDSLGENAGMMTRGKRRQRTETNGEFVRQFSELLSSNILSSWFTSKSKAG